MLNKIKKLIRRRFTKNYWQSQISSNWHKQRKEEAYNDFVNFAHAIQHQVENLNFTTVIEIGTGAGTLITLLSEKLSLVNKFIGIDINKQQILENQNNYRDLTNVEFVHMDIDQYIQKNDFNHLLIVSQNTLDYFEKDNLQTLFSLIRDKVNNVRIIISTSDFNLNLTDSVERKEANFKVYDHNYVALLKSAGYEVTHIKSNDMHLVTASYSKEN